MQQSPEVEHQKQHKQVEQDDDARRAYLVGSNRHWHRHTVGSPHDACEQQQEGSRHKGKNQQLPYPTEREQAPDVPTDIGECC